MIIDASNKILGRLLTKVAKLSLLGETIDLVNCEKALISGPKKEIVGRYYDLKKEMGQPTKGPFIYRLPDTFVKRSLRGMLPYKQERGKSAYKRVNCYIGLPSKFKDQELLQIKEADVSQRELLKFMNVGELCKSLGGKFKNE